MQSILKFFISRRDYCCLLCLCYCTWILYEIMWRLASNYCPKFQFASGVWPSSVCRLESATKPRCTYPRQTQVYKENLCQTHSTNAEAIFRIPESRVETQEEKFYQLLENQFPLQEYKNTCNKTLKLLLKLKQEYNCFCSSICTDTSSVREQKGNLKLKWFALGFFPSTSTWLLSNRR